jgi:hypothetical protein
LWLLFLFLSANALLVMSEEGNNVKSAKEDYLATTIMAEDTISATDTLSDMAEALKLLEKALSDMGGYTPGDETQMCVYSTERAGINVWIGFNRSVLREYISRIHGQADNSQR